MQNKGQRVFKTPIIVPLSVIMVVVIHFGYMLLNASDADQGILTLLSGTSFEVLVLSEVGMISMIVHNKRKIDGYLARYPQINSQTALEELKPIARTNMYSALFTLVFLAMGSLTAIMTIMNDTVLKGVMAAILCIIAARFMSWYGPTENALKQIPATEPELEQELEGILDCWQNRAFPNF